LENGHVKTPVADVMTSLVVSCHFTDCCVIRHCFSLTNSVLIPITGRKVNPQGRTFGMMDSPARIVVQRDVQGEREFELTYMQSTIGRSPDNEIPIPDPEVSRRHAQIVRQSSGYAIVDLGSTNGTFVNDVRVTELTPLKHGDFIRLGDAIDIRFFHGSDQPTVLDRPALVTPDDEDTAPLPPLPPAMMAQSAPVLMPDQPLPEERPSPYRRLIIGCVTLIVLLCLCMATVYFLDSYQQGRLLYCGGLRPLWETILGPFGFSPICP
jgi:hypothetical protein